MENIKFVNPYNFISLSSRKTKRKDFIEDKENLTGYLDISVNVKNSVIIPGQLDEKTNVYDYYHYPESNKPVLPGSQLRGVIRGVYEALTNSCLSSINTDDSYILSKRVPFRQPFKPYILQFENGRWFLIECDKEKYYGKYYAKNGQVQIGNDKFDAFDRVSLYEPYNRNNSYDMEKDSGSDCMLHIGNLNTKGKYDVSVFLPVENYRPIALSEKDIKNFEKTVDLYNKYAKDSTQYTENYNRYKDALKNCKDMTVYALIEGNKKYISPAAIGRKMAYNNLSDCYKGYESCNSIEDCCPSCSMFGFVNEKSNVAYTGKVRFLDLYMSEDSNFVTTTRKFVSLEPKVANFNFYSTGNDWDANGVRIRGRKFYWHNSKLEECKDGTESTTSKFKSLDKNGKLEFNGKIYFKNLTKKELQYLIFAVSLGNDEDHMHHIGHAKPFGFGSVSIKCNDLYLRHIDTSNDNFGIQSEKQDLSLYMLNWSSLPHEKYISELEKITNYKSTANLIVHYPYLEEGKFIESKSKGYSWFVEYPNQPLPYITSSDLGLPANSKPKQPKGNGGYRGRY